MPAYNPKTANLEATLPEDVPLPCDDVTHWRRVLNALEIKITNRAELEKRISAISDQSIKLNGLQAAYELAGMTEEHFFTETLPYIIEATKALQRLKELTAENGLKFFKQSSASFFQERVIDRELGISLMANMFFCTFHDGFGKLKGFEQRVLQLPSFSLLHTQTAPQEVAKLRMFLNYFERARTSGQPGQVLAATHKGKITIERIAQSRGSGWFKDSEITKKKLMLAEVTQMGMGFEDDLAQRFIAQADFANMFIGGGVLSGGCVQEEIRFSISPENCLAMLVSPCMLDTEAIQIRGAEQFSKYSGYAFGLQYDGDHLDKTPRDDFDGTVKVAILAMDAIDFRGCDTSFKAQLATDLLERDLRKCYAAFQQTSDRDGLNTKQIATGNWGSGAFGGSPHLKAVIQWAASSARGRQLKYYPFNLGFGGDFKQLSQQAVENEWTVKDLIDVLFGMLHDFRNWGNFQKFDNAKVFFAYIEEAITSNRRRAKKVEKCGSIPEEGTNGYEEHLIHAVGSLDPQLEKIRELEREIETLKEQLSYPSSSTNRPRFRTV